MTHAPILVLGATGKTGRRIVSRLRDAGLPVRLGSRSASPAFDWYQPGTWGPVLEGVHTAYVSFYPDLAIPEAPGIVRAFVESARTAGVNKLVLLSGRGEANAEICERIVAESGLRATLLRASWFSQNFSEGQLLPAVLSGVVAMPAGAVLEPFVDADDLADVAVAALTDARHDGQLYELTGPRLLSFDEAARILAAESGRPVTYLPVTHAEFHEALTAEAGPEVAHMLTELCREVFDGRNERLGDGVQRALDRAPRDFVDSCRVAAATGVWAS